MAIWFLKRTRSVRPTTRFSRASAALRGAVLVTAVVMMLVATAPAAGQSNGSNAAGDDQNERIATTREALGKWVEVKKTISRERRDWRESRQMLKERIEVVQREIESLKQKIAEAEKNITEADKERQKLIETNEKLKAASASLKQTLTGLERRTKALLDRVPAPAFETVKPLSQRLPDNPGESDVSLNKRFPNVIGILNELNKFNGKITAASEVRELSPDRSAEVTALYVGLGQAYYVGSAAAKQRVAGYATPAEDGWRWQRAPDAAPRIADAIDIYENNQVAAFVPLPVSLNTADAAANDGKAGGSAAPATHPASNTAAATQSTDDSAATQPAGANPATKNDSP